MPRAAIRLNARLECSPEALPGWFVSLTGHVASRAALLFHEFETGGEFDVSRQNSFPESAEEGNFPATIATRLFAPDGARFLSVAAARLSECNPTYPRLNSFSRI